MSSKLSNEEIARLIALAEAATPGPWEVEETAGFPTLSFPASEDALLRSPGKAKPTERWTATERRNRERLANLKFTAAAREAVPALCRALLRAREDLQRARALLAESDPYARETWRELQLVAERDRFCALLREALERFDDLIYEYSQAEDIKLADRIRAELDASKADASEEGGRGG